MKELENKDWFFLDGHLYRYMTSNRRENTLKAFDYTEQRVKVLTLSEAKRNRQAAFDTAQVSKMLNRSQRTLYYYMSEGLFVPSGRSYRPGKYYNTKWWYSEDDVLELRDVIFEHSRTAKAPMKLPTREEVRAMVRTKKMIYVQEGDDYVPIWRASNW